jgi:hypothetical protein
MYTRVAKLKFHVLPHCNAPITNGATCVALYPSNTKKRNALLSVGKGSSNAYIVI